MISLDNVVILGGAIAFFMDDLFVRFYNLNLVEERISITSTRCNESVLISSFNRKMPSNELLFILRVYEALLLSQ